MCATLTASQRRALRRADEKELAMAFEAHADEFFYELDAPNHVLLWWRGASTAMGTSVACQLLGKLVALTLRRLAAAPR